MTDEEKIELVKLVAEAVAKSNGPDSWMEMMGAWPPTIVLLAGVLVGIWRAVPQFLKWSEKQEKHREQREDKITKEFLKALREVTTANCVLANNGGGGEDRYQETATARLRMSVRR